MNDAPALEQIREAIYERKSLHPTVIEHRRKMSAVIRGTEQHLRVGQRVRFYTQTGHHMYNGCLGEIVQIQMAFTRGGVVDYKPEDYCAKNLRYAVAIGYDSTTGAAKARWDAKAEELTSVTHNPRHADAEEHMGGGC